MTIEEFNKTKFSRGMKVSFKGEIYDIISVDFEEVLIGIREIEGSDLPEWKRCENCEFIK